MNSLFLWHTIVNLSGILESKAWLFVSEITRLIFMPIGLILFNDWYTQPLYLVLVLAIAMLSAFWTMTYFKPTQITNIEDHILET